MKNSIKILAALAVLGFAGNAFAQASATATGTANATIIKPITITPSSPRTNVTPGTLDFGTIIGSASGGTVTEAGGSNTYSDASLQPNTPGHIQDAYFTVTGQASSNIDIWWGGAFSPAMPAGFTLTLNVLSTSTGTMGTSEATSADATLDGSGNYILRIGGALVVPANAAPQSISSTWQQTVAYE